MVSYSVKTKIRLYQLDNVVLKVTKPEKLLGGISSNTLDANRNAILDRAGRIEFVFDQVRINDYLLIVLESKLLERMFTVLDRFLKFTKSKIEETKYKVYYDLDRSYNKEDIIIDQKVGQLILTHKNLPKTVSKNEFTLFRVDNNIPVQGIDFDKEMVLNVSDEFVSFTKGCFIGQEVVARVRNLAKPPRRLVVISGENIPELTSKVKNKEGRTFGFCFVKNDQNI